MKYIQLFLFLITPFSIPLWLSRKSLSSVPCWSLGVISFLLFFFFFFFFGAWWWAFWEETWNLNAWANLFRHLLLEREEDREVDKWQRHCMIAGNSSFHIHVFSEHSFSFLVVSMAFFFHCCFSKISLYKWKWVKTCGNLVREVMCYGVVWPCRSVLKYSYKRVHQ